MSFQPVVHYNDIYLTLIGRAVMEICSRRGQTHRRTSVRYLTLIGIVAFIVQLQLLHLLRYHKTISILGTTLASAMWTPMSMSERRQKSREREMSLAMWTSPGERVTIPSAICSQRHVGPHQLRLRHGHHIFCFHHSHLPPLPRPRRVLDDGNGHGITGDVDSAVTRRTSTRLLVVDRL